MNVYDNRTNDKFENIGLSKAFEHDGKFYMRLLYTAKSSNGEMYNAVNLEDGTLVRFFDNDTCCHPVNAIITVE